MKKKFGLLGVIEIISSVSCVNEACTPTLLKIILQLLNFFQTSRAQSDAFNLIDLFGQNVETFISLLDCDETVRNLTAEILVEIQGARTIDDAVRERVSD